jgi:hypothetical protein
MRRLLTPLIGLAAFSVGTIAHAEVIAYDFTAEMSFVSDSSGTLADAGVNTSTVSGTFYYDTDADVITSQSIWGVTVTAYESGGDSVDADGVDISWTGAQVSTIVVGSLPSEDVLLNQTLGGATDINGTGITYASEYVFLGSDDELWNGTTLPDSLSLDDFSDSRYYLLVHGESGTSVMYGAITSLSHSSSSPAGVPEFDPKSFGAPLALVSGGALVLSERRRRRASTALA